MPQMLQWSLLIVNVVMKVKDKNITFYVFLFKDTVLVILNYIVLSKNIACFKEIQYIKKFKLTNQNKLGILIEYIKCFYIEGFAIKFLDIEFRSL